MAREIDTILQQEIDEKDSQTVLDGLDSDSKVAIWYMLLWIHAVAVNLHEQTWDILKAELEGKIAKAGAGSGPWLRERILEFQAGDNVQYNNGVIAYPVVDASKRIITRCSITQDGNRVVKAKVAKSDPPVKLSVSEQTEVNYYINQIRFEGTEINLVSEDADLLYVNAEVQYDGQYAEVIQSNVNAALTSFCQNLSGVQNFNGLVELNQVEDAIQSAEGVKRVKLNEVAIRAASVLFPSRSVIYNLASGVNQLKAETVSGYIVEETEAGYTFSDSITYTAV